MYSRRLPILILILMLLAWYGAVTIFKIPDYVIPSPLQIAGLIPERFVDLRTAVAITGGEALGGLLLSAAVGIAVGLFFSVSSTIRDCFYPYVILLQTIPIIAISPLILLWLGNGSLSVVCIAFLISLPAIIVNTTQGLISVDANMLDLFRMGNASLPMTLFKLRFPHALPSIFVGLKIAAGASVVGALVGETFAGTSSLGQGGLGYSSIYAMSQLATPYLFTLIFAASLLGLLFFFMVSILERLTVGHWHESILGERIE